MTDPYSHIDDYLHNRLSNEDKVAFELALASDQKLHTAVENHDVAMILVGSLIEDEVRGVISDELSTTNLSEGDGSEESIINNYTEKPRKTSLIHIIRNVAAVLIIGLLGVWGYNTTQHNKLESKIWAQHYKGKKTQGTRGDLDNRKSLIDSVAHYYDLNDFQTSLDLIPSIDGISDTVLLSYKIHNLFSLNEHKSVISLTETHKELVSDSDRVVYIYSLLLSGNKSEARAQLMSLPEDIQNEIISLF